MKKLEQVYEGKAKKVCLCELNAITVKACHNCHNGNPADESMCGNYRNTK